MWQPKPELVRALVENPDDEAKRKAFLKDLRDAVDAQIEKGEKDAEVMELMVHMVFGTVAETVYVVCKLAVEPGEELAPVFNDQAVRLEKFAAVIDSFAAPGAIPIPDREARSKLAHFVSDLIRSRKGNLSREDIKSVLERLEPLRNSYAKKCE
jgi:hypothetical protein